MNRCPWQCGAGPSLLPIFMGPDMVICSGVILFFVSCEYCRPDRLSNEIHSCVCVPETLVTDVLGMLSVRAPSEASDLLQ